MMTVADEAHLGRDKAPDPRDPLVDFHEANLCEVEPI